MRFHNKFCLLLILSIALVATVGCKKHDNNLNIKGNVYDPNLKQYLANVTVVLASSKIEGGTYNPNYQNIASVKTDAGGNFSFEFVEEKVIGYRISLSKSRYFDYSEEISADKLNTGETYSVSYYLYPQGFIKLHVKNLAPFDENDIISYFFSEGYKNCLDCCGNTPIIGNGILYEETTICKTFGDQNVTISWTVKKNNNLTAHSANIFCPAFDTVSYDLNY